MRKLILSLVLLFSFVIVEASTPTMQLTKLYEGTIGNKTKNAIDSAVKFGGRIYDSLVVTVPYGACPLFEGMPQDSTAIRYGNHGICIDVVNDSVAKNKPDSVYVETYLNFLTTDGRLITTGLVLNKTWVMSGNSTFNIDPANTTFKTYMMRQEYFRATLTIKIYIGYRKTLNKVTVYKYNRNSRG